MLNNFHPKHWSRCSNRDNGRLEQRLKIRGHCPNRDNGRLEQRGVTENSRASKSGLLYFGPNFWFENQGLHQKMICYQKGLSVSYSLQKQWGQFVQKQPGYGHFCKATKKFLQIG